MLGLISYGVYLWHLTIAELLILPESPHDFAASGLDLVNQIPQGATPICLVLTLAVSCAIAWLSYRFVELPFLRAQGALSGAGRPRVPAPAELAVGAGTAVFVAGTCFAPGERSSRSSCSSTARSSRWARSGCRGWRRCTPTSPTATAAASGASRGSRRAPRRVALALRARLGAARSRRRQLATIPLAPAGRARRRQARASRSA